MRWLRMKPVDITELDEAGEFHSSPQDDEVGEEEDDDDDDEEGDGDDPYAQTGRGRIEVGGEGDVEGEGEGGGGGRGGVNLVNVSTMEIPTCSPFRPRRGRRCRLLVGGRWR